MATFKRKKIDKIVWQPRIEHWYNVRKVKETLPEKYKNKEILEIYDDLGASVRYYYGSTMDISSPKTYIRFEYAKGAKVKEIRKNYDIHMIYETPIGQLKGKKRLGEWGCSWYYVEHPVKSISDLKILEYMGVENTIYAFYDYSKRMKEYLKIAEEAEDQLYEVLEKCPASILNFGENIDDGFDSPRFFNEYLVPYYRKRVT